MNYIDIKKIFFSALFILFTFNVYSQIPIFELIGNKSYEAKNTLGKNGYDLILEDPDGKLMVLQKKVDFLYGGLCIDRFILGFCNNNIFTVKREFQFLSSSDVNDVKKYFNKIKNEIQEIIDPPKPRKRKELKTWKPFPSITNYNILKENELIRENTVWLNYDGLRVEVNNCKQVGKKFGWKDGVGMSWVGLTLVNDNLKEECRSDFEYVDFFKKYVVELAEPDKLEYYLAVYIDDLHSNGVFDHLNITVKEPFEIIRWLVTEFEVYFEDIRESSIKPDYNKIAIAHAMDENCLLKIQVDYSNWNEADNIKRLWIMYHELTHDLFNVEHGHGGPMMNPSLPSELTKENFLKSKQTLINYLKLIKFKETCSKKGEDKLKKLLKSN